MLYFQLALLSFSSLAVAFRLNGNNNHDVGNSVIIGNGIGNVNSDGNSVNSNQGSTIGNDVDVDGNSTSVTTDSVGSGQVNANNNSNGSGCQQICGSSGNTWQANNQCYCGNEGKKLGECVFKASPTWPLLPAKLGKDTQCPSPVTDSAGFSKCTQDKIKQADPNAQSTVNSCVSSTGAKSTGSV